jgi:cation transport ATPase
LGRYRCIQEGKRKKEKKKKRKKEKKEKRKKGKKEKRKKEKKEKRKKGKKEKKRKKKRKEKKKKKIAVEMYTYLKSYCHNVGVTVYTVVTPDNLHITFTEYKVFFSSEK